MKASLPHPLTSRLLTFLLVSLLAACIEPPRRSGIVDSLNSVSFEPPAGGRGAAPPAAAAGPGPAAENGSALARAEIYGASSRRVTNGRRAAAVRADEGVTLNFDRADIREAVRVILGDVLRKNYTIDPQVNGEITLASTAPISEADLLNVLESALRGNGATLVQVGADTFQILPLEDAPASAEVAPIGGQAPTVRPGYGITVVPLRNVSASAAAQFIQPLVSTPEDIRIDASRNILLFAGTHAERQSVVDMLADLDVNWLADKSVGIFPLRVSTPEAVIPELQTVFGSLDPNTTDTTLVRFVPIARLNAILAVGTNPGQIEEVERWVARLDRGRTVGTQFFVYNLKHAAAEDVAKLMNEIYSDAPAAGGDEAGFGPAPVGPASLAADNQDVAEVDDTGDGGDDTGDGMTPAAATASSPRLPGGIKVVANKANNSLLIRATPASFETMEATLLRLDTSPLQVLIEATIVEVLLNDALRYGVQYFIKTEGVRIGFNSGVEGGDDFGIEPSPILPGFNFIVGAGNSNLTIDALSRMTDVKVLSSPSVVVLDNREATLTVGDEVPITTRQAVSVEEVDSPLVSSIEYRNTGVILQVRPRINVDGAVNLEIAQEVSRVADTAQGTEGELTPTITQRKITSRVAVQSGQTVVLGGLIEDAETRGRDRVPVLGEIPVVGSLFGTTDTANRRTELIVFITPRVIRNAMDARDVSEELRARLKSLRPLAPEAALPPVPQPTAPLPQREPVPLPAPPPAGPQPVVPPGTFGQAPASVPPEVARQALEQGVPEEWLPDLVGAAPAADPAPAEVEPEPAPVIEPPSPPAQQEAAVQPEPPPSPPELHQAAAPQQPPSPAEPQPPSAAPLPTARPAEVPPQEPMLLAASPVRPVSGTPRNGFDLARAPVPNRRPLPQAPALPSPRPATAPVEWE